MIQSPARLADLHAFCASCPDHNEVKAVMASLGFSLTFHMDAKHPRYKDTPPLPAQYHFKDGSGTEVIFLAGKDSDEEGRWITPHASRWWIYPGRSQYNYSMVKQELAKRWKLSWKSV